MERLHKALLILFAVWFAVGLFIVSGNLSTPFDRVGDFIFILLGALVVLASWIRFYGRSKAIGTCVALCLMGMAVEAVGLAWGFPFGQYAYTGNFGPRLPGGVPAAIPLAWWVIVGGIFISFDSILFHVGTGPAFNRLALVFLTASFATAIDFVLEPVAVHVRGYWMWKGGGFYYGVPVENFLSWFVFAAVLAVMLSAFTRGKGRRQLRARARLWACPGVLFAILIMFTAANAMAGHRLAVTIGVGGIVLSGLLMLALRRLEKPLSLP